MDEDKKIIPEDINLKTKETVVNQLDSFINPTKDTKETANNNVSYYSGAEIKTEPMIKVLNPDVVEDVKQQNRPIVRTYKSDVEQTIQTSHISSVNIAMAENKKMMEQEKVLAIENKKAGINKNILIISTVLIIAGSLAFFIPKLLIQINYGEKKTPVDTSFSQLKMTVDAEEKLNLKDLDLTRVSTTLKERVDQSSTQLGQIKNIYLTEGIAPSEKLITSLNFLNLIHAIVPPEIQRTLKDSYMFGLYNYNGNQRFVILKVGSYDTTYSGMLSWETNLWQDFKELFGLNSDNSTSTDNSFIVETRKFQDATFNNKDCRIIKAANGNIIFLYSIIDPNTIVITTSTDTLKEIINRISKARVVTQ